MAVSRQATNKEQNITIKSSGGLSDADIEKMVREAEQFATTDKARKDAIEAKNELETAIYSAEKSFAEYKVRRSGCLRRFGFQGSGAPVRTKSSGCLRGEELRRVHGAPLRLPGF